MAMVILFIGNEVIAQGLVNASAQYNFIYLIKRLQLEGLNKLKIVKNCNFYHHYKYNTNTNITLIFNLLIRKGNKNKKKIIKGHLKFDDIFLTVFFGKCY